MNKIRLFASFVIALMFLISFANAISIVSVSSSRITPGGTGSIDVEIENNLDQDATDISFLLDLTNTPFTPVDTSETFLEELEEGDDDQLTFRIKATNSLTPGDYQIPYTLTYTIDEDEKERKGSVGIIVEGNSDLAFTISTETPVIGSQGKIDLKIINKGFGEAKFLTVSAVSEGYTLLSDSSVYIGNVDSDDFETASFDVLFTDKDAFFTAIVQYKDFNNNPVTKNVVLPLNLYTQQEAIDLGIIQKSNVGLYVTIAVILLIIWLIYRSLRKRSRLKKSLNNREG